MGEMLVVASEEMAVKCVLRTSARQGICLITMVADRWVSDECPFD
jgi:hypothetical protein